MATMRRSHFTWSGWPGAPGHTSLYFTGAFDSQAVATVANTFMFNANTGAGGTNFLPAGVKITQDPYVDELESTTGNQTGRIAVQAGTVITGVGTLSWASPAGSSITWSTDTFLNGRRVRGRTYFVPLDGTAFQNDGSLATAYLSAINLAIGELINAAPEFIVWHRPTSPNGTDGLSVPVVAGQVLDKVSILTSRR
jgi:hypothetical protein